MKEPEVKQDGVKKTSVKYTKVQILASKRYEHRRDILNVLLKDNKEYTPEEIDSTLDKFMKGKVK